MASRTDNTKTQAQTATAETPIDSEVTPIPALIAAQDTYKALSEEKTGLPFLIEQARQEGKPKEITRLRYRALELEDELEASSLILDDLKEKDYLNQAAQFEAAIERLWPLSEEADRQAKEAAEKAQRLSGTINDFHWRARAAKQDAAQVRHNRIAAQNEKRRREVNRAILSPLNPQYMRD